jgi:stearoyl-CoA desaturase (delta-9 desaturase)
MMSVLQAARPVSPAGLPENITVDGEILRTAQKIHAVAIVLLPTLGLLAAVVLAFRYGMTAVDLALFAGMSVLTMVGISVGYHRHFSHRAFQATQPIRVLLAVLGSAAAQGSLVYWVANHRRHHQYTDRPGDIHSPYVEGVKPLGKLEGFWHSHMGWTFDHEITNPVVFAKDLYRDRVMSRVNGLYLLWVLLGLLIPLILGGMITGTVRGALTGFLWGGLARMFAIYHVTNAIDSVTHIFGSRPFETGDHSTNNAWLALPTLGESWHNNHHAFPYSAVFSLRWWQLDLGSLLILGLRRVGWAWDVRVPAPEMVEAKRQQRG